MVQVSNAEIACLPVAGPENPYQSLMMKGLNESGHLHAFHGVNDKFFGILRTAVKFRPDYLHFDWIASYYYRRQTWLTYLSVPVFCFQLWLVKYVFKVRIVWTLHNILPHDLPQIRVHRYCQRFLARHCTWIRIFTQDTIAAAVSELQVPESTFVVVPEGSYVSSYPNHISAAAAREKLELPLNSRILLFIGLIKPYKGILELIRAFKEIDQPGSYLVIAGKIMDADYGARIRQEISGAVRLYDHFIPGEELQNFVNAADVIVLPFHKIENSGSVILAMGFSKPVIAPETGSLSTRLSGQPGLLFNHHKTLKTTLKAALSMSPQELSEIGDRNFQKLEENQWTDFQIYFEKL